MRVDTGDQGCCSSRWMGRLCEVHDDKGESGGQGCCQPLESWVGILLQVELEDSRHDNANESAEEVAKDEGSWLRQRDVDGAVTENRRSALTLRSALYLLFLMYWILTNEATIGGTRCML